MVELVEVSRKDIAKVAPEIKDEGAERPEEDTMDASPLINQKSSWIAFNQKTITANLMAFRGQ